MNHAALIFLQHANDLHTELLNDKNLSHLKPYLIEIGEHLNQLNKKVKRYINPTLNDIIIDYVDDTHNYIIQARDCYMRKLVTLVKYEQLRTASDVTQMCRLLNDTIHLYNKTVNKETRHFVNDFENIRVSCNRLLTKYDCMLNENNKHIDTPEVDQIFQNMCNHVINRLIKENKK